MNKEIDGYKAKIRFEETKLKQEEIKNGHLSTDRIMRLCRIIEYHEQIEKIRTEQIKNFLEEFIIIS